MPYRDILEQTVLSEDPRQLQSNKRLSQDILSKLEELETERQAVENNRGNPAGHAPDNLSQASQFKSEPLEMSHLSKNQSNQAP